MLEIVEEEYKQFLYDFEIEGGLVFGRYVDEDDYEDEYSHNDIENAQEVFISRVEEYLHDKSPNKYIVAGGWCVFIMTIEEAKKRKISRIEDFIVR